MNPGHKTLSKNHIKNQPSKRKRILSLIGIPLGILVFLIYIALPAGMGIFAILPGGAAVGSAPQGFEEVTLLTQDGVQLSGWYAPPENGAAILLLHGAGDSRERMRPHAEMLKRNGFGVLAVDLRGHGQSGGKINRLGWQATLDVGAAVDFLRSRSEVEHIGGLGSSMGGEALLGAASAYPDIEAVAADGATRRCLDELLALETERPLVRNFTARVMFATVQLASGEKPPLPMLKSIKEAPTTRFLLIAAGNNAQEVSYNQLFKDTLGERAVLWVAPGAEHLGAFSLYPNEYEQRVIALFDALASKKP